MMYSNLKLTSSWESVFVLQGVLWSTLLALGLPNQLAIAQETPPKQEAAPKTVKVKVGAIRSDVVFPVTFVPKKASQIVVDLKTLPSLTVLEAVSHGDQVNEGDILVHFDVESLNNQIEAQERTVDALTLSLEEAQSDARLTELQAPLDLEQAEIAKKQADEDFAYYEKVEKDFNERANEQRLKSTKDSVDYTAEELKQLEKMYKADDLTEQSEEIVLRRARDDLDRQKFFLEQTELSYRRSKELLLPRAQRDRQSNHRLAEIAWERFQLTFPLAQRKRAQSLVKIQRDLDKAQELLTKLRNDLEATEVKAPHRGVVYFGRVQSGKWVGAAEARAKLKKYGSVGSHEVIMTIVSPDDIEAVGNVPESEVTSLRVGAAGKVTPAAIKHERLEGLVRSVSNIPVADGQFEVVVEFQKMNPLIVAGMTGSARVITYYNPQALSLPAAVVHVDDQDDRVRFVYVASADGKPVRKNVEVGVTQGDHIEIRSGVDASESILIEKP